jgi:hypothetical protein
MDRSSTSAAAASTSRRRIFHIFSTQSIHVGSTFKFVYTNSASFGAAVKKRRLSGIPLDSDKVINRHPLRKSKKASARGKKVRDRRGSIFDSLAQSPIFFVRDSPKKYSFMYTIHYSPSCNNIACIFEPSTRLVCGNTPCCFEERRRWVIVLTKLMCMTTDVCFDYER